MGLESTPPTGYFLRYRKNQGVHSGQPPKTNRHPGEPVLQHEAPSQLQDVAGSILHAEKATGMTQNSAFLPETPTRNVERTIPVSTSAFINYSENNLNNLTMNADYTSGIQHNLESRPIFTWAHNNNDYNLPRQIPPFSRIDDNFNLNNMRQSLPNFYSHSLLNVLPPNFSENVNMNNGLNSLNMQNPNNLRKPDNFQSVNNNRNFCNLNNATSFNNQCDTTPQGRNVIDLNHVKVLPTFDNREKIHPVEFLENIELYFNVNSISFRQLKFYLNTLMENSAKTWFQAYSHMFGSYNDFKNSFLQQYWGPTLQLNIKLKLESGRYQEEHGSFVDYFNTQVASARHLYPPYTEQQLIAIIARHFPPNISATLVGTDSLLTCVERLRQADYYFKNDQKKNRYFLKNDTYHFKTGVNSGENKNKTHFEDNKNFPRTFQKKNITCLEVAEDNFSENE
ncbi:unnamed protein product [Psylliodes chrysocephalus]|uniref:Uncharacterized protein n=1 Tax=Psylliodes chrysocephalus TaxID=3402493 RepID=A0A9P0G514_9CUCU|nr:unnamed protein product [Psylliodes chrysocephala]